MRRWGRCVAALGIGLLSASWPISAEVENIRTVEGSVALVKAASKQVVMAPDTGQDSSPKDFVTYRLDDKSKLGKLGALSDLRANDSVVLTYADNGKGLPKVCRLEKK